MKTQTGIFKSFDGAELFYREWEHDAVSNGKIIIILHRGHEHSERLESIAAKKEFEGYKIFSYDNRGHGYTKEGATYEFMNLVRDLDAFVSFVSKKEQKQENDIFIIANSVAGVVASTWVHDYAPNIRGMALIAPAFKIKLYFPCAKEFLKMALYFKPELNIKSYVKSKFLTHDLKEQERYDNDTLITPNIPARQLTTLLDTAQRVVADAALITVPTLVLSATKDYVVDSKIQGDFYAALSSSVKKFVKLENFYHGILYEDGHQVAIDEISAFMELCFSADKPIILNEMVKVTQAEYDKIAYGSLPLHREVNYTLQKTMMKQLGGLSKGMGIGLKYGFDSGVTLDHVYKNEPSGTTWIGRAIDKGYLNSIGWKGIRQRKVNMIAAVEEKIKLLQQEGKKVSILDIAGGPARYLIEIASKYPDIEVRVRDYQEQNVNEGQALAKELHLDNIVYEQCDAFNPTNYNAGEYSPNIVVISGVFELFGDNDLIANAIKGVSSIIAEEGYLLYTGQPWHPQLEQIANVLGNHQNEKWIMRRRSQYELDHLFALRGFEKEQMQIDDWGIFTVSSAKMNVKG
ncbi:bifunctional alpha/beta hydrolase/class I SAM-dependent methyltransferase [bacterium]|nr:bifunctional alpha/beta hydrolase/class I SAM-dependent methyltransferase [bacterium]MBU1884895.1 bifunctional alpha/beta hydrolase/class I SAM-dependent methyltransferase [bacterium]